MHIEILDDAQEDMLQGTLFYESQQYGAGDYFLDSVSSDIDSLHLYAGIHSLRDDYYVLFSKRFPIYAVLDERQNPQSIVKRLK